MMQRKNTLMLFVPVISFVIVLVITTMSLAVIGDDRLEEVSQSEIAEQKSVIHEQAKLPCGGVALYLEEGIVPIVTSIPAEETPLSQYASTIDSLTEEEKELICRITYREAGNQDEEGRRGVIEVILNRLLNPLFPDTVYGVLSQPSQFSTWSKREEVTLEQVEEIMEVLMVVRNTEESVFVPYIEDLGLEVTPSDYLYFDGKQHTDYATNYISIQDHWFGTRY